MGAITGLLFLPFTAPVMGFHFVLERLRDEADAVLHDEGRGFAELIALSMRHKAGQLSDAEFAEQETELLERLSSMREYREAALEVDEDWSLDPELDLDDDGLLDGESDLDAGDGLLDDESDDGDGLLDAEPEVDEVVSR